MKNTNDSGIEQGSKNTVMAIALFRRRYANDEVVAGFIAITRENETGLSKHYFYRQELMTDGEKLELTELLSHAGPVFPSTQCNPEEKKYPSIAFIKK